MEEAKVGKILPMLILENVHRSLGFCYQKNPVSPAEPPKQDIGRPPGDFGIIFFTRRPPD